MEEEEGGHRIDGQIWGLAVQSLSGRFRRGIASSVSLKACYIICLYDLGVP